MLQPWLNALTQDVLGAMVCLEAIAAIGLVVTWGSDSYVLSEGSLMASTLEFGRSIVSRLKVVGTQARALGSGVLRSLCAVAGELVMLARGPQPTEQRAPADAPSP
jgi:hypothetical protein